MWAPIHDFLRICPACLASALALGGCAVGPDFKVPEPPSGGVTGPTSPPAAASVAVFSDEGPGSLQTFAQGEVPERWWELFSSPELNRTVQLALSQSPTLEVAAERLHQSEALLQGGYGLFVPSLDFGGAASRERSSPPHSGLSAPSTIFNLYTLAGTVSYPLDLFGGERRQLESLSANVALEKANRDAAYQTLTANVVTTTIARSAYAASLGEANRLLELARERLRLTQVQAKAGLVEVSDVLAIDGEIATAQIAQSNAAQRLAASTDLLASLCGVTPSELRLPPIALGELRLPRSLPAAVPSRLLRRRPDIRAAEASLHAASAQVGIATANLFPSLSLTAAYGTASNASAQLLNSAGRTWDAAAALTLPVFRGGTLWSERNAALAFYKATLASYRQVVLAAFAQVGDTMLATQNDGRQGAALEQAAAAAAQAFGLAQANHRSGRLGASEQDLAEEKYRQAVIASIEARATRLQDSVAFLAALGFPETEKP